MRTKLISKLFLALAIPLLLVWAVSSISPDGSNLALFKLVGSGAAVIFGVYACFILFSKFGRSMKIASREKDPTKKILFFVVFFLLIIVIIAGLDKFFQVAFKLGGF
jgi:hypothetical protein